jgi:cell wall-associated NlpC family hydrolase
MSAIKRDAVTPRMIVREARRFLGVPYLWGGISPAGFDCSGLVRALFGRYDIYLPRDTKDQIKMGRHIDRTEVRAGDLLFFKRHVGLALGRSRILHASVGGSGVRINSLTEGDDDYRADLDRDYAGARRLL